MAKIVLKKGAGYKGDFYPPGTPIEMEDEHILSMIEDGEDVQIIGELKKEEKVKDTNHASEEEDTDDEDEDADKDDEEEDDEEEEEKPKRRNTVGNKRKN